MADVDARLAEIAERAERAMPGPWCYMATGDKDNSWSLGTAVWPDDTPVSGFVNDQEEERFNEETMEGEQVTPVDLIAEHYGTANTFDEADFIAHARDDVPWLLAENTRLRAALAVFISELARAVEALPDVMNVEDGAYDQGRYASVVSALGYMAALQPGHAEDEVDEAVLVLREALAGVVPPEQAGETV